MSKRDSLCYVVGVCNTHIVVFPVTWQVFTMRNGDIFEGAKPFNTYRRNRGERNCGGVLIAIADNIRSVAGALLAI